MSSYRVAPLFLLRTAGVPFDLIERLATKKSAGLARELLVRREELAQTKVEAEALLSSRDCGFSAEVSRVSRALLRQPNLALPGGIKLPESIARFTRLAAENSQSELQLQSLLQEEFGRSRVALHEVSLRVLPDYLVFGAGDFRDRLSDLEEEPEATSRNARARERDRHLLLYLQRVCAKNDTYSAFGPSAWGVIDQAEPGLFFTPGKGPARREVFLERWAAYNFAAAMKQDSDTQLELSPRLHPNGRIEDETFVREDDGRSISLTSEALELIARCDGKTPAHLLVEDAPDLFAQLVSGGVLKCEAEVPAMDPHAFDTLISGIEEWRESPARTRWLERAQTIRDLPKKFGAVVEVQARAVLMAEARQRLDELGGATRSSRRALYAAANPIAEECFRDCTFRLSEKIADQLAGDAAPWFDLWRDTYAFVASRVAAGLRGLFETAPARGGLVSLPAFFTHCAANEASLTGNGLVRLASAAFAEVKEKFRAQMSTRVGAAECELTANDCAFVRQNFSFPKFDEYTYPSADLQISAKSFEAVGRGEFEWIVGELHPPVAILHHALYWSCPDKPALSRALASTTFGKPGVHYGFGAADFTAHTTVRLLDALPELTTFVAPQRSHSRWQTIPTAEVEVFVADETGDVGMRHRVSKKYLGSFARAWIIPLGFHPFHFGIAPHTPRFRCGKVIVQRRAWTAKLEELSAGNFAGISRELVLAVERLRAQKNWPRYIYIRPTEQALRRSGAEGRDKDTKPVFIDLESYLSLEIFHRWLTKSGELEVTEMLPDPDHLCWQEADGRRTFELRTLIVPRA